ncbi:S-layer homology domain-containing protein [Agathobaculum desmolans]|uniref:S-layer homology domain-containing protein n=1 Tax=Agathobaculum desmolans TaxID=39484 RepID=UPI00248E5A2E|nr:S-layer homology domain-containing protein [Agathobaculum desmolans]
MKTRLMAWAAAIALLVPLAPVQAYAAGSYGQYGFTESRTQETKDGTYHLLHHTDTGAQVVWLENDAASRDFAVGFRTPPEDSKGANHVLEHSLLCGSEQYPLNDLMHILRNSSVAEELNAYTSEDHTAYVFRTANEQDYYNLADIYMSCVLFPRLREEPNIFKQQGIRVEYQDGKARYNGIVFSELKLNSLETEQNSLNFVSDQMYRNLYGDSPATYDTGGGLPELLDLTYEDVMRVWERYYKPSNMLIYLSGQQELGKMLRMIDGYLDQADHSAGAEIHVGAEPVAPAQRVQEYNVSASTRTVDIGFMAHGPSVLDAKKKNGWGALVTVLHGMMKERFPDALPYTVGSNAGGIYNVGIILSGIPATDRAEAAKAVEQALREIVQNGIDEAALHTAVDDQQNARQLGREDIFMGFVYDDDPFAGLDQSDVFEDLRHDQAYFKELAQEWLDSPYQTVVVSGNGAPKPALPEPVLDAAELEQVKQDTAQFEAWLSQPDDPAVLSRLPRLDLSGFADDPFAIRQTQEQENGVNWYWNEGDGQASFSLEFPITVQEEDAALWTLLCEYLNDRMEQEKLGCSIGLSAGQAYREPETLHPRLCIGGGADPEQIEACVRKLSAWLQAPPLQDAAALRQFLTARRSSLRDLYLDPYQTEYGLMLQASTQENRFLNRLPAGFVGSSLSYKSFVDAAAANPGGDAALLEQMRVLWEQALTKTGVSAELTGSDTAYRVFRREAAALLAALPEGTGTASCDWLAGGWPSALVVTRGTQDANHVMMTGAFAKIPENMAVYDVLAPVLTAKYILPELRDRRGAYGAGLRFDAAGVTVSCAGGVSVDEAVAVFRGAAAYLRTLELSEGELAGFKVNALNEFDQYGAWERGSGAALARSGRTQAEYAAERKGILQVTVQDLRACAADLEEMLSQGHVFAHTTAAAAAGTRFPFAARADAATGRVTPLLRDDLTVSADRSPVTRGEMAVLLADSLADRTAAEQPDRPRFTDTGSVPAEVQRALAKLYDRGLLQGYEDGSFRPEAPITRAEFCAIASALSADGSAADAPAFTDVPRGHWAYPVIAKMAAQGILQGKGNGKFEPNDTITHQEVTLILQRLARKM